QSVIDLPEFGIVNVHASLLPKYRGAGPIQWAIVNGETRTGVTTMQIDAGLDTGAMLLKAETEIAPEENAIELGRRLAVLGADLLVETLAGLQAGTLVAEKQDGAQATLAPLLKKEDGLIDWRQPALAIHNRVRGLQPWPGAQTTFRGQPLHIWKSRVAEAAGVAAPGTVLRARPLLIATGDGALELLEVQLEGRKRIAAADFANGQRIIENEVLGAAKV
ncbi:MAG: methionyl-tRNA formyltransferase, partial [Candidatus Solibacter sp.]|nr:methionyl-tRNA formyltransferase [Candidatus Solibacter sp.]